MLSIIYWSAAYGVMAFMDKTSFNTTVLITWFLSRRCAMSGK
jgi:hypothetical protein